MKDKLEIRFASNNDLNLYFEWVNDKLVRLNSLDSNVITYENHKSWFIKKLNSSNCYLLVMDINGKPAGQIRFEINNEISLIDYSIDKKKRGIGLGNMIVKYGIDFIVEKLRSKKIKLLKAIVKRSNLASINIFMNNGFTVNPNSHKKENIIFEKKLTRL